MKFVEMVSNEMLSKGFMIMPKAKLRQHMCGKIFTITEGFNYFDQTLQVSTTSL